MVGLPGFYPFDLLAAAWVLAATRTLFCPVVDPALHEPLMRLLVRRG